MEQTRVRGEWKRVAPSKEESEAVEKNVALMLVWHVFLCDIFTVMCVRYRPTNRS